jgi:hypothetical protein
MLSLDFALALFPLLVTVYSLHMSRSTKYWNERAICHCQSCTADHPSGLALTRREKKSHMERELRQSSAISQRGMPRLGVSSLSRGRTTQTPPISVRGRPALATTPRSAVHGISGRSLPSSQALNPMSEDHFMDFDQIFGNFQNEVSVHICVERPNL